MFHENPLLGLLTASIGSNFPTSLHFMVILCCFCTILDVKISTKNEKCGIFGKIDPSEYAFLGGFTPQI